MKILIQYWHPDGELERMRREFPDHEFIDGRDTAQAEKYLPDIDILYSVPSPATLAKASKLRWLQLPSAGVPGDICGPAKAKKIHVTNLAGLYGPTIAEHALAMMLFLYRNLHLAHDQQKQKKWERNIRESMCDLRGKTLAIVGAGNIGQNIARLAKGFAMQVLGCRRHPRLTPYIDGIYGPAEVRNMLAKADVVAVAAPFVKDTDGMLGKAEFQAMPTGTLYINVSRGIIAQESALLDALKSQHLRGAGLDVFAVEPLPAEHPFWTMPNVLISPHYSGETVNLSSQPCQRFTRNLRNWLGNHDMEGVVDLELGY